MKKTIKKDIITKFEKELKERLSNGLVLEYPEVVEIFEKYLDKQRQDILNEIKKKAVEMDYGGFVQAVLLEDIINLITQ